MWASISSLGSSGRFTASRVYLEPPAQQTYNGEDLVAWLGLDPYGSPRRKQRLVWSAGGVQGYRWLTLITSARAVSADVTVSLRNPQLGPCRGDALGLV